MLISNSFHLIGSFVYIVWAPWDPFGFLWSAFGSLSPCLRVPLPTLGHIWDSFGAPGAALESLGDAFGRVGPPVGSPWGTLDCIGRLLGTPWGHFWLKWRFGRPRETPSQANGSQVRCLRTKISLPELSLTCPYLPPDPPEVVSGSAAQTPPPRAPGARMTGVKQTPSNLP